MTKILLTGASGLLGLNLAMAVDGKKHQVLGVANTTPMRWVGFKSVQTELTEPGSIEHLLEEYQPEVIIHCAALANVDDCEHRPDAAEEVNARLPGRIAAAAKASSIKMVHISTDAVFDGIKGDYLETDEPHPLSIYARTKWGGEQAVLSANENALVARVNFYGWSVTGKRSLAEWFVNNLSASQTVKGFTDIHFCPMMVLDLVDILMEAIDLNLTGLYHVVGAQKMSKFEFGRALARKFGFDPELVQPASVLDGGLTAARSPNLTLNTGKIVAAIGHPLPDFETGLQKFYDQYRHGFPELLKNLA
ncbi:MAG: SDR family oxidoreductase [Anaerolineaceae bacterium]|nr:SDR family oxidoreductase [Anaerolineaceae bacterium]